MSHLDNIDLTKIGTDVKLTEEQKMKFEKFYEQYKNELPEGISNSIKTFSLGVTMLIGYTLPEEVEDEIINISQRQLNYLQEFLNTAAKTVKSMRNRSNESNGENNNHDEIL